MTKLDLSGFDTSEVENMRDLFSGCSELVTVIVSDKWNTDNVEVSENMFDECTKLAGGSGTVFDKEHTDAEYARIDTKETPGYFTKGTAKVNKDTDNKNHSDVEKSDSTVSFDETTGTLTLHGKVRANDIEKYNKIDNVKTIIAAEGTVLPKICNNLFNSSRASVIDLSKADTSNVIDMSGMFWGCTSLTSLDLSGFDTSNVINMQGMFGTCSSLKSLDLRSFDTSKVKNMKGIFCQCLALESINVSSFDTSNVTDMSRMFVKCESIPSLDLNNFDTSKVTDMSGMFEYCEKLKSLAISGFNTSNVMDMSDMFSHCYALPALYLSMFDTSNVRNMYRMFYGSRSLSVLDLSSFDTSSLANMIEMFAECSVLKTICVHEDFPINIKSKDAFDECGSIVGGGNTSYDKNHTDGEYARIGKEGKPGYFILKRFLDDAALADSWYIKGYIKQDGTIVDSVTVNTESGNYTIPIPVNYIIFDLHTDHTMEMITVGSDNKSAGVWKRNGNTIIITMNDTGAVQTAEYDPNNDILITKESDTEYKRYWKRGEKVIPTATTATTAATAAVTTTSVTTTTTNSTSASITDTSINTTVSDNSSTLTSTVTSVSTTTTTPVLIPGDVNTDGIIDGRDATAILTYYAVTSTGGEFNDTSFNIKYADYNEDSLIDGRDATAVLTHYAKSSIG